MYPHHIFLLQNVCDKVMFCNVEQVRDLTFAQHGEDDADPCRNFYRIIPDDAQLALLNCLAWGCVKTPDDGENGKSRANKKSG